MEMLLKGQRQPLAKLGLGDDFQVGLTAQGLTLDFVCFGLDANGKLADERYMTFFNQPKSPCGGLEMSTPSGDAAGFAFRLARLPASIERVVITASIDGDGVMSKLASGYLRLMDGTREAGRFAFTGADFAAEKAVMLGELYRKDGQWRFMAVGQGFNGGLDALVAHFGGTVAAPDAPVSSSSSPALDAQQAARVSLEKRAEREAPQLVSLIKHAGVSLAKVGLSTHRAKVCLVLDISGSMGDLYRKGLVQQFSERILALGCKFDDDGEIDVFLFGRDVHQPAPMNLSNCTSYVKGVTDRHALEGGTYYGKALEAVRKFYFPDGGGKERKMPVKAALPVYVMFVTDGETSEERVAENQVRWSSREPIFWQFMGIGKSSKSKGKKFSLFGGSDFAFLEELDNLDGRLIDNANFFSVESPDECSDEQLYDLLMTEYPGWLKLARQHGLLD